MIVVWDNGGEYSDHKICFVDTLNYDVDDCLKLLSNLSWYDSHIICSAQDVKWFKGGAIDIDKFISFWSLKNKNIICDIKPKTLKGFFRMWKEDEEKRLLRIKRSERTEWMWERYEEEFKPLEKFVRGLEE